MIIVMVIYLGQEIYSAVFVNDNISQLTHILGGLTGGLYGMTMRPSKK
jgi:membrane associated rhomboid family serine protease